MNANLGFSTTTKTLEPILSGSSDVMKQACATFSRSSLSTFPFEKTRALSETLSIDLTILI